MSEKATLQIGMGATVCGWSDKYPATVVEILRFKTGPKAGTIKGVVIQYDAWKVVSGSQHDGSAQYDITPDANGEKRTFLYNFRDHLIIKGGGGGGDRLFLGTRRRYYDPHF